MTVTNPGVAEQIQLGAVLNPAQPTIRVAFFRDTVTAWRHVCDHLLSVPECRGWVLVANDFEKILDPEVEDAHWQCAESGEIGGRLVVQELYNLYLEAVSRDAEDAALLSWHANEDGTVVSFGTSGILMVIDNSVRTAFLAGAGSAEAVRQGPERGEKGNLCRNRGMRSGRRSKDECDRDVRLREQREAHWNKEERCYYLVFRPAVQFLRQSCHAGVNMFGEPVTRHYHLVKKFLPPRSCLDLQHWKDLRRQCGRGGSS
ncbi:MAG: hypothetical protein HYX68_16965 [Planctomycetes bacterium]|nr:hypothetical protein [Planctomycetota bacterium]